MKRFHHNMLIVGSLTVAALLTACNASDDTTVQPEKPLSTIRAALDFSLPQSVVGSVQTDGNTRMTADIVQRDEDAASFRGLDELKLLCFNGAPAASSTKWGNIISLPTMPPTSLRGVAQTNHLVYPQINLPVATTHVTIYGEAMGGKQSTTRDEMMRNGKLQTVGLTDDTYTDNSGIRFRPVPICTTDEATGGSPRGQALLNLLNDLLNTVSSDPAPDNQWPTTVNPTLKEAYKAMSSLTTSSSFNVQAILDRVYRSIMTMHDAEPGEQLAQMLRQKIADHCSQLPASAAEVGKLVLDDQLQGYPADLRLPSGSARIIWNAGQNRYELPDYQAYGKELNIPALTDYVYPPSLQYSVSSEVVTSDTLHSQNYKDYTSWQDVIDNEYAEGGSVVDEETQSVAIVRQLEYAVGRLDARIYLEVGTFYDAYGKPVNTSQGYTLTGYIIGGQHEVGYDYRPVGGTKEYFIYDRDINHAPQHIRAGRWTDYNHTLGLETPADENTYLALELVNDGDDFQGADGLILHGATFYLVADLSPKKGENYSAGTLDRIFRQDYVTRVHITIEPGWPDRDGDGKPDPELDEKGQPKPITGLATATYGLPKLEVNNLPPVVGLSVNLVWNRGIAFPDVEL